MKSIKNEVITSIEINKSKFINYLVPVSNVDEVPNILQSIRKKHYDANHHTYAYIIGLNQEHQKCSDDGEPSKTAGYPMLDVLKKNDLTNVLNVSVRYFGGTKLGAGGLIRAYVKSCTNGIENATFSTLKNLINLEITIPFDSIGQVEKFLRDNYVITDTQYKNDVSYYLTVLETEVANISDKLIESTKGIASINIIKQFSSFQE
ncbi:MAG: YigZ family protein [Bacilli bacterium]|nr:YigZ family protein [Bacilli bacterium]